MAPTLLLAPLLLAPVWTAYRAPADRFSVLMPGPTKVQTQNTQGVTTRIYASSAPPYVCAVSKTILPGAKLAARDLAQMESAMKGSMLASSHSTATGERAATYSGIAGRQMEFRMAGGGTGAMWIGRTPKAVYSLTFAKQIPASATETKRFFASFKQG